MAKTKLKSVFTREDVYTVLQLLKALADGVDNNEALTDEDIKKLQDKILTSVAVVSVDNDHKKIVLTFADNTTIESVPFESGGATLPQGYEVDSTGKVIINKALTAVSEGDVEVRNNLIVDGKAKLNSISDLVDNNGNPLIVNSSGVVEIKSKADATSYLNKPGVYITKGTDGMCISVGVIALAFDSKYAIKGICVHKNNSEYANADEYFDGDRIDIGYTGKLYDVTVDNSIITVKMLNSYIKTYYQHTVHITFGTTGTSVTDVCFTAVSTKSNKITDYNTLHSVFGGRKISVSGIGKCWSHPGGLTMTPLYLDLHGGSISTDKIMGTDSATVLGDPLSTFVTNEGAIVITDDVTQL